MPVSRRSFLTRVGAAATGVVTVPWISARGQESVLGSLESADLTRAGGRFVAGLIRLDSNENPYGPPRSAIDAISAMFGEACRYPDLPEEALRSAVAALHRVPDEWVILGCGSTELLRLATEACTTPSRHLVTVAPTFEVPATTARRLGVPVRAVPVDSGLRVDLSAMLDASRRAGLVFLCNPNNPTGTAHPASAIREFVDAVHKRSPETYILIDEAYFEYADDPSYATALPLAMSNAHVIVSRTFSKVFGLAGVRAGYAVAHPDTIKRLDVYRLTNGINVFGAVAARASLGLPEHIRRQQQLNRDAKAFTVASLGSLGYRMEPSQTNFVMVDIQRDPKVFQTECRARGVAVGRPFPPLATHARISIGTMDEMKEAMNIIAEVLKKA